MAIIGPDPGKALELAKTSEHDAATGGFKRGTEVRWLRPESGAWVSSGVRDRTVSPETFALLKGGEQGRAREFTSPGFTGPRYALVDDGFEARAELVDQ